MSEDVKPRQWWIDDITERVCAPLNDTKVGIKTLKWPDSEKVIIAIELEPTLQLMKEMGEVFEKLGVRGCEYFNSSDYPDPYGLHIKHRKDCIRCMSEKVLDKYRKFLEGIK